MMHFSVLLEEKLEYIQQIFSSLKKIPSVIHMCNSFPLLCFLEIDA